MPARTTRITLTMETDHPSCQILGQSKAIVWSARKGPSHARNCGA